MDIRLASASASRAREVTVLYALVLGCVAGIAQAPASRRDQGPEAWLEAQGSGSSLQGCGEAGGLGEWDAPGSWLLVRGRTGGTRPT